jgi:hypothetical protein
MYLLYHQQTEFYKAFVDGLVFYIEKEISETRSRIEFLIPDTGYFEISIRR